ACHRHGDVRPSVEILLRLPGAPMLEGCSRMPVKKPWDNLRTMASDLRPEPSVLPGPASDPTQERPPWWLPTLEVSYLLVLLLLGLLHADNSWLRSVLPDPIGPVPLGIVYFGALGGVTIGLYGLFFHQGRWDHSYDLWHATRPFL